MTKIILQKWLGEPGDNAFVEDGWIDYFYGIGEPYPCSNCGKEVKSGYSCQRDFGATFVCDDCVVLGQPLDYKVVVAKRRKMMRR